LPGNSRSSARFLSSGDHLAPGDAHNLARAVHHHEGFEVEHPLQFAQGDVQQVADAARQALEKPYVRAGAGQLDVPEALAADARQRDFHAALVADDAAVLHALVLAAQALPILVEPKIRAQNSPSRSGLNVR